MHAHFARTDPGDCPVCGAAHCTCGGSATEVVQLPNRDASAALERAAPAAAVAALGDGSDGRPFSTATYRGTKKKGKP
jgi:hypothetical protein